MKLRLVVLSILIILLNSKLSAQKNKYNCWLPEAYVNGLITKDTGLNRYLIPISTFYQPLKNCVVVTYKADPRPQKIKKLKVNGKTKYQLVHLDYNLNLPYYSEEDIKRYEKAKLYISKTGNKLLLEIIDQDSIQNIYFIDRIKDYRFQEFWTDVSYLKSISR